MGKENELANVIVKALNSAKDAVRMSILLGEATKKLGRGFYGDTTMVMDLEAEKALVQTFKKMLPDVLIVSEESGEISLSKNPSHVVVADPLDGSLNASRGIPFYSTAIAISEGYRFDDIVAAGVMDLVREDLFVALRGKGVTLNGKALGKKGHDEIALAVDLGDVIKGIIDIDYLKRISGRVKIMPFLGSVALEIAYIANCTIDCFLAAPPGKRIVDIAASLFIVKEAGGEVISLKNDLSKVILTKKQRIPFLAACNMDVAEIILSMLTKR